jgi:predicted nucleic acid-binding protein
MKILIEGVAEDPHAKITTSTRRQRVIDANAILEAFLLEYGVEAALEAVRRQGFSPDGNYATIARQLYKYAQERKAVRMGE